MSRNHLLLLGLLAIPTVFLTEALAAERSVESFTDYAKRRIADTDADTLEAVSYTHLTLPTNREV